MSARPHCVYCDAEVDPTKAAVKAHFEVCKKSPYAALKKERTRWFEMNSMALDIEKDDARHNYRLFQQEKGEAILLVYEVAYLLNKFWDVRQVAHGINWVGLCKDMP